MLLYLYYRHNRGRIQQILTQAQGQSGILDIWHALGPHQLFVIYTRYRFNEIIYKCSEDEEPTPVRVLILVPKAIADQVPIYNGSLTN